MSDVYENRERAREGGEPSTHDAAAQSSIDALIANLVDTDLEIRLEAQHALASLGTSAVPSLVGALSTNDAHLRGAAAQTLVAIHNPETAPVLARALDDDEPTVRWLAAEGLIALGRVGFRAALHFLIVAQEISPQVREALRHILLEMMEIENMREIAEPVLNAVHGFAHNELILVEAHRAIAKLDGRPETE